MIKIFLTFVIFIFFPLLTLASAASDFIVNPQPTYAVPPGTTNLLILDLTLPGAGLTSIKINNAGTVAQYNLSKLTIYEDGPSAGWDGDESEMARKSFSPFFDAAIPVDISKQRIFVTVNVTSTYSGKTIVPELEINSAVFSNAAFTGPTDKKIIGFERKITVGTEVPYIPVPPIAKSGEAISASTIRWHFTDLSSNEFGFKILDRDLKIVAEGGADISYLDETGLEPDTEYSGRQVKAFNDRGQSSVSTLTVFPAVKTLPLSVAEETRSPDLTSEVNATTSEVDVRETGSLETGGPLSPDELRVLIQELQLKIIDLLKQLIQLLQEQASKAQASLFGALDMFANWLESRF